MSVTAIVLAGGRSSRFGAPKLDADLGDGTLLDRTISRVRDVADELVICLGRESKTPDIPGARIVLDAEAFGGPLVALENALDSTDADFAIVIAGDMPRVRAPVLHMLLAALEASAQDAVVLEEAGQPRPLPLALRVQPALAAAGEVLTTGDRSLRALITELGASVIAEGDWRTLDPAGDSLVDIDTPEDLAALRASDHRKRGLP